MTSKESVNAAPWLIPGLVQNILRKSENDGSITVHNITSKRATADGDNYLSDISRVHVEFQRGQPDHEIKEKKTLIFKVSLNKDTPACDVGDAYQVFETESEMMENTLVRMNEILNENNYRLSARAFHTQIGDPSFLVLQDLVAEGFRMGDRKVGLDLDHALIVVRGLAKFHASSIALHEKNSKSTQRYKRGIYNNESPEQVRFFIAEAFRGLSAEAKNWPELDPSYSEKLLKLSEVCFEKGIKCSEYRENDFNVLNHGDAWMNNLMFKYDSEGKVVNQIFLDFQLCMWTSPAYDLYYSLCSHSNDETYINHFDTLVAEYSKMLTSTMLKIKCKRKPPSLDSIRQCMKEREFLAVLDSIVCIPFTLVDESEVVSLSDLVKTDRKLSSPGIKDKRFRRLITKRLKDWNARGLLDV
ncbi:uncharacterized protein [Venturia canescens]|uniref:uncharacterized protein n=1 Tax=Venturia canescens TaxID=32260 RepID=UPI001C9CD221|nr:uncharacterized protein LOC122415509 [Venturia canescens]